MPNSPANNPLRLPTKNVQNQGQGLMLLLACLVSVALAFALTMIFVNSKNQSPPPPERPTPALPLPVTPSTPVETDRLSKIQDLLEQQTKQMAQLLQLLENQHTPESPTKSLDATATITALKEATAQLKALAENNQPQAHTPSTVTDISTPQTQRILQAIDELPFERYEQHLTQVLLTLKAQEKQLSPEQLSQLIAKAVTQALSEQANKKGQAGPFSDAGLLGSDSADLTDLQQAFHDAFVTGKPITLPPQIDTLTGLALPGRTIDPQTAYRAGHRTWQAWYKADRIAEEKRLSQSSANNTNPALTWE